MAVDKQYPESELTDKIIGIAIAVHKNLKSGFVEKIYQRALYLEFRKAGLKVEREKKVNLSYKNANIGYAQPDFIINDKVVIETKAVSEIKAIHKSQLLSYLKLTNKKVGLILNFAKLVIEIKRVVN